MRVIFCKPQDKVNVMYTDIPLVPEKNFDRLSRYTFVNNWLLKPNIDS
jgi:hypothetical protein